MIEREADGKVIARQRNAHQAETGGVRRPEGLTWPPKGPIGNNRGHVPKRTSCLRVLR